MKENICKPHSWRGTNIWNTQRTLKLDTHTKKAYNPISKGQDTWRNSHEKRCHVELCLALCDLTDCSMPGSPVLHYLSPRVCSHSYPLSRWCHPAISSYVIPFSSCPQSFPASGSFPMSWFFFFFFCIRWLKYWSFSISPSNEYSGFISFRIDWLGQLSLAIARLLTQKLWDNNVFF